MHALQVHAGATSNQHIGIHALILEDKLLLRIVKHATAHSQASSKQQHTLPLTATAVMPSLYDDVCVPLHCSGCTARPPPSEPTPPSIAFGKVL
jgi:hypothetical protein